MSAYLKLRGDGPVVPAGVGRPGPAASVAGRSSASSRGRRSGWRCGDHPDPYAAVSEELARYRIAPLAGLPPFAGGAVGMFGYDLVRSAEPSVGAPHPDEAGIPDLALMVTDVLVAFDHLRHEVTVLANVLAEADVERSYDEAAAAIAEVSERLARAGAAGRRRQARAARVHVEPRPGGLRRGRRARQGVHPRRATPTRSSPASAGRRTARSTRSRSTADCARSTRARTCTSSTSRTSRWPAPRPSRSSRSPAGASSCGRSPAPGRAPGPTAS